MFSISRSTLKAHSRQSKAKMIVTQLNRNCIGSKNNDNQEKII